MMTERRLIAVRTMPNAEVTRDFNFVTHHNLFLSLAMIIATGTFARGERSSPLTLFRRNQKLPYSVIERGSERASELRLNEN
jgi:hypothetical protein